MAAAEDFGRDRYSRVLGVIGGGTIRPWARPASIRLSQSV